MSALSLATIALLMPFLAFAQAYSTTSVRYGRGYGHDGQSSPSPAIAALGTAAPISLPIPVLFGVSPSNLSPNFGDPRDNGARTHLGEDIMADKDTPIVSPIAGVVLRNETGASEGNAVYVAAPGGYTLVYMHLDKFAEGVTSGTVLSPGSLIGYVGNTGDAAGGASHLHFEVHDATNTAIDPMVFLTQEFSAQQKISFLSAILSQTSDPPALSQLLVSNFSATFVNDQNAGITLPPLITGVLASVPASSKAAPLPVGDLAIGSTGVEVVALQRFLIAQQNGNASALVAAGATGYFGAITQSALSSYQSLHGLFPADGVYTGATRGLIAPQLSLVSSMAPVPVPIHAIIPGGSSQTASPTPSVLSLTRDLSLGSTGQDVLALQKFFNSHGFAVSLTGAGSAGSETSYFGPATQAAAVRFQVAHMVTPTAGYVGPLTRAALAVL